MSEEHESGHVQNHQIRTLIVCGRVILPFYRFLCEKLDLDFKRIKKHDQIPYTHMITMTIKSTIYYWAVFIQEHKIKCRGN